MTSRTKRTLLDWLIETFGGFELLQLFLLGTIFSCAGLGLSVIISRLSSGFILLVAMISVWIAWMMSRTRLPNWGYGLLGPLAGVLGLILTVGGVGRPVLSLLFSFINIPIRLIQNEPLEHSALNSSWQAVGASISTLAVRFIHWLNGVNTQSAVIDPTVISIVWGMLLWLAVFWGSWWVLRRTSVLFGFLPTIILLGFNTYYTKSQIGVLWLTVVIAGVLVLQASTNYGKFRQRWILHHLAEVEIEPELIISVVLLSFAMTLAGYVLPTLPFRQIANAIEEAFQRPADQDLAKSLGLEQTPIPIQINTTTGLTPTENHIIGPGPTLAQDVVMFVSVDGYYPPPQNEYAAVIAQSTEHFYWRAQIFSEYSGSTWLANTSHTDEYPANQLYLPEIEGADDNLITQHVTRLQTDEQYAFADSELLYLDQPSTAAWNEIGDVTSVLTFANSYSAVSRVPAPSVEELRAAGEEYPHSIRSYLELPDDLPPRIIDLSLDLTANLSTPYDRAALLEAYLRQFPYSLEVPGPPPNRDAVDYFLFDLKSGYCDYYASAFVVMARAAGIPARLVMGYSEGVYDQGNGYFIVRSSNAHAWAELYFPTIGWVKFEPTPSQPLPFRPGQTVNDLQALNLPPPGQEVQLSLNLERTWMGRAILKSLVIALFVFIILLLPLEAWWLSSLPAQQVLVNIFRRLYRFERSLGIPPSPSRTPNEFGAALSKVIEDSTDKNQSPILSELKTELAYLTNLYNLQLFSEHYLLEVEKPRVIQVWIKFQRNLRQIQRHIKLRRYLVRWFELYNSK